MDKNSLIKRKYLIIDLDNTIYSTKLNLLIQIDPLIKKFIMEKLSLNLVEANNLRLKYYHKYGATIYGLMKHHNIDGMEFSNYVHNINYDEIKFDQKLYDLIENNPLEKYIFTNGSKTHAENVLEKMGLEKNFKSIYSLEMGGFFSKPLKKAYNRFFAYYDLDPQNSILCDDIIKNLVYPNKINCYTIWIRENEHIFNFFKNRNYYKYVDFSANNLKNALVKMNKIFT